MKRISVVVSALAFAMLSLAAPAAQAGDFCVGVSLPRCPVSEFGPAGPTIAGIFDAIDAADLDAGPDSVVIGAGTMHYETGYSFSPNTDTEIVGAGGGQTIFESETALPHAASFWFPTGGTGSVSGISVNVTGESANGIGLSIKNGTVSDFSVTKSNDTFSVGFVGLDLADNANAHDGTVAIHSNAGVGMNVGSGPTEVHHVDVTTDPFLGITLGVRASDSGVDADFHHVHVSNFSTNIYVAQGNFTLTNSVIDLGASYGNAGFSASADNNTVNVDVNHVTIVGDGPNQAGFYLGSGDSPSALNVDLFNFVAISQFATFKTIYCAGGAGAPQPVDLEVERFAMIGGSAEVQPGCSWDFEADKYVDLLFTDPGFVDRAGGDYRLLWNSPLVDAADPTTPVPSGAKDYAGGNRLVDGNGDGTAITDLGAFEYQRLAPEITLTKSTSVAGQGQPVTFEASAVDPEGEAFTLAWSFSDGATAGNVASVQHAFTGEGPQTATVTATDEAGASASAVATVVLPTIIVDDFPATARIVAKAKKAFKRGGAGFAVARKGAPSFSVAFTNTKQAKFTLQSIGKMKRLKKVKGQALFRLKSATTKFGFGGNFGGKKLKAGKYRVTITPLARNGKAGKPVTTDISLK